MKPEAFMVVTADQRRSRHHADHVPDALAALAGVDTVLPFERTAGDEVQGLLSNAHAVVEAVARLSRLGDWRVGLGLGAVELPLPNSTRAARGDAYLAAREAVESTPHGVELRLLHWPLSRQSDASARESSANHVSGSDESHNETVSSWRNTGMPPEPVVAAETVLWLLRGLWSRRTSQGWEVAELMGRHDSKAAVAKALQISPSAVSQRVRTAQLAEEARGRELAVQLLIAAGLAP